MFKVSKHDPTIHEEVIIDLKDGWLECNNNMILWSWTTPRNCNLIFQKKNVLSLIIECSTTKLIVDGFLENFKLKIMIATHGLCLL
jgi:hypothetical protein